jgi:hypothetical protein
MDTKTVTIPCTSTMYQNMYHIMSIDHVQQPVPYHVHQPCKSTCTIPCTSNNTIPYTYTMYHVSKMCQCLKNMPQACDNITNTSTSYMYQEYVSYNASKICLKYIPMPQQDTKGMIVTSSTSNQGVPQACSNIHKPCTKRYHQTCAISLIYHTTNHMQSIYDVPLTMYHTITKVYHAQSLS